MVQIWAYCRFHECCMRSYEKLILFTKWRTSIYEPAIANLLKMKGHQGVSSMGMFTLYGGF